MYVILKTKHFKESHIFLQYYKKNDEMTLEKYILKMFKPFSICDFNLLLVSNESSVITHKKLHLLFFVLLIL